MKKIILSLIAFGFFAYPILLKKFLLRGGSNLLAVSLVKNGWIQVGELIFFCKRDCRGDDLQGRLWI